MQGSKRGNTEPITNTGTITLRSDQKKDSDSLVSAFKSGAPEVLVASKTGTGKTFTSLTTAMRLPDSGRILVVCPKSAIPTWEEAIKAVGDQDKRFCIINYEQIGKLLKPANAKASPKRKTKKGRSNQKRKERIEHAKTGIPFVAWDVVIFDEAHYLGNPESQRSLAADRLVSFLEVPAIYVSATIAKDPMSTGLLSRGILWRLGKKVPKKRLSGTAWIDLCKKLGFKFNSTRWGDKWEPNDHDLKTVNNLLFQGETTWAVRTDPGWDVPPRYQVPIEMTAEENALYEKSWQEFNALRKSLKKLKASGASGAEVQKANQNGLAAQIRYRQKAGILKAPYVADMVKDLLEGDVQVAVSCEFKETVLALMESLGGESKVALFTGFNEAEREQERLAFQRGQKRVILFTPSESFNLHQNDASVSGTSTPRVQICAEPSWRSLQGLQKEGRTSRNGEIAPVLYPSAVKTTDYKIIKSLMQGYENIRVMMGDNEKKVSAQKLDREDVTRLHGEEDDASRN